MHAALLPLTDHAMRRSQQRGKMRGSLHLVYQFGDLERRAGPARFALRLSHSECEGLLSRGASLRDVERAARVELIVAERDGAIITVLHAKAR